MTIITRFAPSPTGNLHLGGARTALFNFLYAKKMNGKFLLRIEDTDKARTSKQFVDSIINGLKWLNLSPDKEPVFQSENINDHQKLVKKLLNDGYAYKCYLSESELNEAKEYSKSQNIAFRSPWRDKVKSDHKNLSYVVRIKIPLNGELEFTDLIQGKIKIKCNTIEDFVILRSDKSPTYMLAVVSDDNTMGISHIIRGDDHLVNTAKQIQILKFLNFKIPQYAHLPLIHGSDGKKLSKRHGALDILQYKNNGYLPEGITNYLSRLGWSHGNSELFSLEDAKILFNLNSIGKNPAKFDEKKLIFTNSFWIKKKSPEELLKILQNDFNVKVGKKSKNWLLKLLPKIVLRSNTYNELNELSKWLYNENYPIISDENLNEINKFSKTNLILFKNFLYSLKNNQNLEINFNKLIEEWLTNNNLQMREIGMSIRIAITGVKNTPPINDIILTLGIDECIKRINKMCI